MATISTIPWKKYGIIAELAENMKTKGMGKTALQKLVYFLQELYNIDCGYGFSFYTYGPYCAELSNDLSYIESVGGVEIKTIFYSPGFGYEIKPGKKNEYLRRKASGFLSKSENQISELLNEFGNLTAKNLELRASLLYIYKESKITDETKIIKTIKSIKPYFDEKEIKNAFVDMKNKQFLG